MPSIQLGSRKGYETSSFAAYATTTLLVISLVLNVVLSRRLWALTAPRPIMPAVGTRLPALPVRTLGGETTMIEVSRPTIFYYFSPTCGWCERNWPNVKALIATIGDRYRFVGISPSPVVREYVSSHELTFDVFATVDAEAARMYNFGGTPRTIVVGAGGVVERVWDGAYLNARQREVERAFAVLLPGEPPVKVRVIQP
jgi:hypothetical protein